MKDKNKTNDTPEVTKSLYTELKAAASKDPTLRQFCMQLYERGLLSGTSMLDIVGFDSDQEIKRFKEDVVQFADTNKNGSSKRSESELTVKLARIENARRNVEALSRLREWDDELVLESIKKNIKVMDEVSEIK